MFNTWLGMHQEVININKNDFLSIDKYKGSTFANIYEPDGLFVVHEGLLEFALLLQDTGQVGMSCCKLWEHLLLIKK